MRKLVHHKIVFLLFLFTIIHASFAQKVKEEFSFIIASDHREHATEQFRSRESTLGGFEAIKKVGQGSFMVMLGDIDPPQATAELLGQVFGKDYLWYPVIGNHDLEVESNTEYIRGMNRGDKLLPHLVRKGPSGSEETTYSFDWNDVHFVVLNVYYDGKSDKGNDGTIVPELLNWLENDLKQTKDKHIFVFGHEPIIPILDMDNGTVRHLGDALDKYPDNTLKFEQLLLKYGVTAYISGHTHCASYASINGLWLINSGHIYGQEGNYTPEKLFVHMSKEVEKEKSKGMSQTNAISRFYKSDDKEMNKFIFNLGFGNGKSYKDLTDEQTMNRLTEFYNDCKKGVDGFEKYAKLFWENTEWRKSTFLKVNVNDDSGVLEIYRDKEFNGNYVLRHSQVLYKEQ
jgi:predicted phosphodiesterase